MKYHPRSKYIVRIALILVFAAFAVAAMLFRGTPSEPAASASALGPSASFTNAPLENNCTACHTSYAVDSGTGNITISGIPANYLPGQQIPVTVTVNQADGVIYGFQMTAIDRLGQAAGTYTFPDVNPQPLQVLSNIIGGNTRQYIEHTSGGTLPTQFGTKSWNFTWTAPNERIGKLRFYAAGNAANSDGGTSGDYIYTTSRSTLSGTAIANFDSDTRSDLSVYRPSTGYWYAVQSAGQTFQAVQWGEVGDVSAPGDYDGDGITDQAVFRPSIGTWYVRKSTGSLSETQFGQVGDIPVTGDYDGDLKSDIAVWRPSTGVWYILGSTGIFTGRQFGESTDKTAQGDYDGDGKTDIAVFRPSTGVWYFLTSSNNGFTYTSFGTDGDKPVPADYDGDGKTDIAVFRPSNSTWYAINATKGFYSVNFGVSTDVPVPADYDGDGIADIAVFRDGTWYVQGSEGPSFWSFNFGQAGDIPLASRYISD